MAQQTYAVADALPPLTHLATLEPAVTPDFESTYQKLLDVQDRLAVSNESSDQRKLNHMSLKVLGFLLLDLWQSQSHRKLGPTPAQKLREDIRDDAEQIALGVHYRETLLRAFRSKGPTSQSSRYPSPPPFDTIQDMISGCLLDDNPTDYGQVKQLALARDGFRCLARGIIDQECAKKSQDLWNAAQEVGWTRLECCHILAQSTTQRLEQPDAEGPLERRDYASGVLGILKSCGLEAIVEIVEAEGIHHLCNILTLSQHAHTAFGSLNVWFDATDTPHQYRICGANPADLIGCVIQRDKVVTLTVNPTVSSISNPKKPISLPHPSLLALHATCCRVAHMSGAAQYFADIDRHMEDTLVLAEDGSSGIALISALQRVVHMG